MCLIVYFGSDLPLAVDSPAQDGAVALASVDVRPVALKDMVHVAMLVDWHQGQPFCSCVFHDESLPWEPREEEPETVAAFDALRALAEDHLAWGGHPVIAATWSEHENADPVLIWRVAPGHLKAGNGLFQGGHLMLGGMPPDSYLIEIDPRLREIKHQVADV